MDVMFRACEWCGAEFPPITSNQVRCSHRCTRRAAKHRASVRRRGGEIPSSRMCDWCGGVFRPYSVRTLCCSRRCRNRRKDVRRAERWKIKREAIFERDHWICLLCGRPIDQQLKHPSPFAATIDHIVPVARDGSDDVSNLQTAHMACNSSKGDALWT